MNELDMSRPGSELFPESQGPAYNSYQDVNTQGQAVDDPLDMGVTSPAAMENPMSDKEMNFRALGDVVSKLKEEREYWKGQAEALTKMAKNPSLRRYVNDKWMEEGGTTDKHPSGPKP